MSKFSRLAALTRGVTNLRSPVTAVAPARTHEGGRAFRRDAKSELFLLAVTNLVGEDTFYEAADARDTRFRSLVAAVTAQDPDWVARFVPWLRRSANLRSASVVAAVEYVRAGGPHGRRVVGSACLRADEPAEVLAYWTSRYGRAVPQPVKRGVADAARRLYDERAALRYDGAGRPWRMGDVLDLAHPRPAGPAQSALFGWLLDRRHDRATSEPGEVAAELATIRAWTALAAVPAGERRALVTAPDGPQRLAGAGMTWESVSGWLGGPIDADVWSALIPSMGYMALLRNLRNFDRAGVPDEVAETVAARLAHPAKVARSRQLPFRFWSAYRATDSARWVPALERALRAATANLPSFPGRTLVLVDTSASMSSVGLSARSSVTPVQAAAVFGVALAAKGADVDLVGFASGTFRHQVRRGASVLREVERFVARVGEVGHGTAIASALASSYAGHDRVVLVTDMQTHAEPAFRGVADRQVPAHVPLYGFNLGGYGTTVLDAGGPGRHEFGGLSDATFGMISMLERGQDAGWPF